MGARETALNALMACRREGAWSNGVLKEYVTRDRLDARDAALATRLCYGVVQNRGKLDFYLQQLLTGKLKDLHPVVRDILHLGLYQIYELDKVPDSAAVNEAVALTKKYVRNQKAASLVNGVLRSAVRTKGSLKEPSSYADKYSHPDPLISLLKANVPKGRLEPMLIANNAAPLTVIQVNTLKTTCQELKATLEDEGITVEPHGWMENALVIGGTGNLEKLPAFREGLFYVQDPAAKLTALCARLPRDRDIRLLDCCAAPGGKSFASAIAMGGRGSIISCDVHPHKVKLIENGAERLGLPNITARVQDATAFNPQWEEAMDCVIADVPCSGLGIIRKKPDIRYKNLAELEELPGLQLRILRNQARYVKKGGILMYATCTILRRENEEIVRAFLEERKDFHTEPLELPAVFPVNEDGMLTLIPGEYDTDGFFICRMRRDT
ncbi:MAG: 16S rRNA (cytosine(967)-C(5))-methyltransferase RsmB [Oscillospiraceae bacterium]|nr:16S rRNA (cytosine(967)-C(5))-methyltransferase RsmB [Oscillospiraceae bacterium]